MARTYRIVEIYERVEPASMVTAYRFVGETPRNGRPEGPIERYRSGLHFSSTPWDALAYAPGPISCLVKVEGS